MAVFCYASDMNIRSAEFIKGIRGTDEIHQDGTPQVIFIGRSNAGKSSLINSLVNRRDLARSSPTPGKTSEINFYLVNKSLYLVDLPGYGYAKASKQHRESLQKLISWYLFNSGVEPMLTVLVLDAKVGLTEYDDEVLSELAAENRNVLVVANKIDKVRKSDRLKQLKAIELKVGDYKVIPFSSEDKTGLLELSQEVFASILPQ
ncbi:MAG TPA: ribosome biogenesis GTP-binding protein YihA/YsxC [Flavobacterium sp.]|nr:ribosome biogenesis GTP-binding protein YihA/YsxC [Flavobacterium sp.]